MGTVPVIALSGYLGAGKTTLLNHVLRRPFARIGVVVNDFGTVNIDAGLVAGQVDDAASISGGCICCMNDAGGLDDALARLARPRLRLDVILLEASGIADPLALVHLLRGSRAGGVRFGGLVDVVDALEHFRTVDRYELPPARYAAADLVVVNKLELVPEQLRTERFERIAARVAERNPRARLVPAQRGGIDPQLLFDVAGEADAPDELPIRALLAEEAGQEHEHAQAVTVVGDAPVDGARIAQLLESPPEGVYRLKGRVTVRSVPGLRRFVVNTAGGTVHLASERAARQEGPEGSVLVAIGVGLDAASVRERLEEALAPAPAGDPRPGVRRLDRLRRLSA